MSVAAFFKESRVRSALAGSPPTPGSTVLADFFAQFDYTDCTPGELLALADLATRCADATVARTALERTVASGKRLHLAHYKLGRLDLAAREFDAALAHFLAGTEADPAFAFNWIGAARALHAMGRKEQAVTFAERFAGFGVRPHSTSELGVIADLGDYLFDAGDRRRSLPLYELVTKFGADRPRDAVRLAEAHLALGDIAAAMRILLAQEKRNPLDEWGRRALAVCYSQSGEHARAIALAEKVALADPSNPGFIATFIDALARAADHNAMRAALARHAALLPPACVAELQARICLAEDDAAGAAGILASETFDYRSRLYHLTFETAYAALAAGLLDLSTALGDRLGAIAPHDTFVKLLRIDSYFRQQLWEQASAILAGMTPEENLKPHVVLKRFEYACFAGDLRDAEELRMQLETMELPSKQFMLPIFRFLAERNRWDDLMDRALVWLDGRLNYAQIGYVLFRAAKHTGRQQDMIDTIEAIESWQDRPDLIRLRATLACDRAETLADIDRLAADPTIAGNGILLHTLGVKRDVLASAMAQGSRRAIFLCSDRNYLAATIVALHSLTKVTDRAGVDFYLVLDDELVDMTQRFTEAFTRAGFTLTLVAASSVIETAEKLSANYGLFTSGHVLSSAAYYRIYFAKYLSGLGVYDRAIYVDSDTIVRRPLDPLFVANLQEKPLAARLESMRPEVRRAIALHQLNDNRYFNSGVLVFDLRHPRLGAALDGAFAAILDDETTLLFHDQCALNLGFRDDFCDLEKTWNFPFNEATPLADVAPDAGILHFLDRPKPWSTAHGGDAARLWFTQWRETASFIGEENAVELFRQVQD